MRCPCPLGIFFLYGSTFTFFFFVCFWDSIMYVVFFSGNPNVHSHYIIVVVRGISALLPGSFYLKCCTVQYGLRSGRLYGPPISYATWFRSPFDGHSANGYTVRLKRRASTRAPSVVTHSTPCTCSCCAGSPRSTSIVFFSKKKKLKALTHCICIHRNSEPVCHGWRGPSL